MPRNPFTTLALTLLLAGPLAAQEVADTSYRTDTGERVQRHEIVVDAPVAEVWRLFTTTEGVTSWMVPKAALDFRLGGTLETSYAEAGEIPHADNIKHEIIAYLPNEMIAMRVTNCPPGTPHPEVIEDLWSVIELEPVGPERTRVSVAGAGYRDGEAHDEVWQFFEQGNPWTLKQLQRRIVEGPIDWSAALEELAGDGPDSTE